MGKSNVSGSIHKYHEFALKFEQAGGTPKLLQKVIDSPSNMKARRIVGFLANNQNLFKLPEVPQDEGEAWKVFYGYFFEIEVQPQFPKETDEFPWGVYIPKGITEDEVIAVSHQYYPVRIIGYKSIEALQVQNLRDVGDTGVRLRERGEADEENKSKSAKDLEDEGHTGITLIEYLILHLFHWWKTGEHLDKESLTLCAGSCLADGFVVPDMHWTGGDLVVDRSCLFDAYPFLRSRSVVSS